MFKLSLLCSEFEKEIRNPNTLWNSDFILAAIQVGIWAEQQVPKQQMWQTLLMMISAPGAGPVGQVLLTHLPRHYCSFTGPLAYVLKALFHGLVVIQ